MHTRELVEIVLHHPPPQQTIAEPEPLPAVEASSRFDTATPTAAAAASTVYPSPVGSHVRYHLSIFHDAENCAIFRNTNGSRLYDAVVERVLRAVGVDVAGIDRTADCDVHWWLVLPIGRSIATSAPARSLKDLLTRGVLHLNPGDKKGAVDLAIAEGMARVLGDHAGDAPANKVGPNGPVLVVHCPSPLSSCAVTVTLCTHPGHPRGGAHQRRPRLRRARAAPAAGAPLSRPYLAPYLAPYLTPPPLACPQVRNPYVDPLNVLQAEVMKRLRLATAAAEAGGQAGDEARATLEDCLIVSVNGIASGMKNSG